MARQNSSMTFFLELSGVDVQSNEKHEHDYTHLAQGIQKSKARCREKVCGSMRSDPSQQRRSEHDTRKHLAHDLGLMYLPEELSHDTADRQTPLLVEA